MSRVKVLHIDLGRAFRGGQRQCYNLIRYLKNHEIETGCVVAAGGELEKRLADLDVETYPIHYGAFDVVAEGIRLRRVCKEMGYNILHAHDSHGHNLALTVKFVSADLRVVVTRRVLSGRSKSIISKWKYATPSVDLLIAVSSPIEQEMLDLGVNDRRVVHIPSGVDMEYFRPVPVGEFKARKSIRDAATYIGTACALDDNKDVATVLNAAAKLSYARDDFLLLVAGDGEKRAELQRLAGFIEIDSKVIFLGNIDEMNEFYSLLDVYVLSSRSEGLGTSLLEAGACGCAVVSSDCGGPGDYIENAVNGYLFDIEDDERLSGIFSELAADSSLRTRLSGEFAKTISRFAIDDVCSEILNHYRRLTVMSV
jgi:glycosyltransferase involved in cell wall biosynthesis